MSSYLGALGAFTASITWAFASTRYSAVAKSRGAVLVGIGRAITASVLWLTLLAFNDGIGSLVHLSWAQALTLVGSIVCSYVVGDRVFFAASARLGVPSAMAIATIYPMWAALFGTFVRGEPLGPRRILGIACCLAGVSAVLLMSRQRGPTTAPWFGGALALLTSLFWAGNAVLLKQGTDGLSMFQANGFRYTVGVFLLLAQWRPQHKVAPLELLREMRLPLALDTGIGSMCFVYGIAHTDLALGATLSSLSPLVALAVAFGMRSEPVTVGKVGAVCLTLLGVILLVSTSG